MYRAIEHFVDLQDERTEYNPGDVYPREGSIISEERLNELASADNKRHRPVIEKVAEKPKPVEKPVEKPAEEPAAKPAEKKTRKRTRKSAD